MASLWLLLFTFNISFWNSVGQPKDCHHIFLISVSVFIGSYVSQAHEMYNYTYMQAIRLGRVLSLAWGTEHSCCAVLLLCYVVAQEYEEARNCIDRVLQMEPSNYQAQQLKALINKKITRGTNSYLDCYMFKIFHMNIIHVFIFSKYAKSTKFFFYWPDSNTEIMRDLFLHDDQRCSSLWDCLVMLWKSLSRLETSSWEIAGLCKKAY